LEAVKGDLVQREDITFGGGLLVWLLMSVRMIVLLVTNVKERFERFELVLLPRHPSEGQLGEEKKLDTTCRFFMSEKNPDIYSGCRA
jgi:hypothetical protein